MSTKFFTVDAQDPEIGGLPGVKLRVSKRTLAQIAAERFQALQAEGVVFGADRAETSSAPAVDAQQGRALFEVAARAKLLAP